MPAVTIPRKGVTADELKSALSQQLGSRYKIVERPGHPDKLKVSTSAASTANVHLIEKPEGTHIGVHGGGFIIGRVINELLISRTVVKAIKASPELGAAG
jgi:hypothetical protein